jgi:hypothetical protein
MNLFELHKELENVADQVDENWDLFMDAFKKITNLSMSINDKLDYIWKFIRNKESDIEIIENEIKRLSERKKRIEKSIENIREYCKAYMIMSWTIRVDTPLFTFSFRKSEAVIVDEKIIDEKYKIAKTTFTVDKTSIKEALKRWEEIVWAILEERQNLQIK